MRATRHGRRARARARARARVRVRVMARARVRVRARAFAPALWPNSSPSGEDEEGEVVL
jgi:hypothetical protein